MPSPPRIKSTHKAIQAYYETLRTYQGQKVSHETALRSAFQNLLAEVGKLHSWTLIPELSLKYKGKTVRPDGTMRDDQWMFPRGYWEAKDTDDDLEAEVRKKINKGYPTDNMIFEDTREGILYQNGQLIYRARLHVPQELADLLNLFFNHVERDFEGFEQAVAEFKDRIPQLAEALLDKIKQAHERNKNFQAAFDSLLEVCRASLNPNISRAAVEEMLVQHLLTERLFERVFQNQDFVRRNVIAAEVEKVIDALVSKSFNRHDFLKSLDPFYKAIEGTAQTIDDFSEKQHFLNTVYERFFQGFSVEVADTHGIVYTPQAIVDFMCASVDEVLKSEFKMRLGSQGVNFLDPCTGTGNFIVNLIDRIDKRDLPRVYKEQLFANEVMLLPYYIAAQNIEHEYFDRTGEYEPFEGICFVDTLELAEADGRLSFVTAENTHRVNRQRRSPITVILGNPPYNMGQVDENDNNKNRKYNVVDRRIAETYARDSRATLKNKLYDPYVKFFRWAIDRLQGRDGIVCFVTNNSFIDQIAFDGMRRHLLQDFTKVYHLDLHGNVRKNPKLSGTTHNVFGIQVGVGITLAVRSSKHKTQQLFYHRVPETWRKEQKLAWLAERKNLNNVKWTPLKPDGRNTWLVSRTARKYASFLPTISDNGEALFNLCSLGVATNRDEWVYDFAETMLAEKLRRQIKNYNYEVFRLSQESEKPRNLEDFINNDPSFFKWTDRLKSSLQNGQTLKFNATQIRTSLYRPFTKRVVYFDSLMNQRRYQQHRIYPTNKSEDENVVIALTGIASERPFMTLAVNTLTDLHLVGAGCGTQCLPFYIYDEDGNNRRHNITEWALMQFKNHYKNEKITKWDIFYYVYGILHLPSYREDYAVDLKRELPRIPFMEDFGSFAKAGKKLAEIHTGYEAIKPWSLRWLNPENTRLSYRVEKMRLTKDKTALVVNETLTLAGIPPETFEYRLGNRSALEWVIDQYQVTQDKRSGIKTDPNKPEDPEYIVRLIGQVVRVSVETVRIIRSLPQD